ncbi:MAG: helix-turn-helix domain-containing protein [Inquilinaceae bacterium]
MGKSDNASTIHVSHYFLPDSTMRSSLTTVLRAGWLDAAPESGISRTECPGDDILYCLSGKGQVDAAGARFDLAPGQLAWLPGDFPHGHLADGADPWSLMWFRMDGPDTGALRRRLFGEARPRMSVVEGSQLIAWFHGLFETLAVRPADIDLRLHAAMAEFLCLLNRQRDPGTRTGLPAGLKRLRDAIAANPERKWMAQDMEKLAGVSASQLRRLFRKHLTTTPGAYLRRERLALAQRMMLDSSLPIHEIAATCGFFDAYHFSRAFKQVIGRPPNDWRRTELGR